MAYGSLAAGDDSSGGGIVAAIVGLLGTAAVLATLPQFITRGRGSVGPRLQKGELSAGQASEKALTHYWEAEKAAARGRCPEAERHWQQAERLRDQTEHRNSIGDESGYPVKDNIRAARKQMRHGKCSIR